MVPSLGTPTERSDGGGSAAALNFVATASPIERLELRPTGESRVRACPDSPGPAVLVVYFSLGSPFREMFNDLATR
jgi:hypothetical protein